MWCTCDAPSSQRSTEKQMQSRDYTHRQACSPCFFTLVRDVDGSRPGALLWFSSSEWKTSLHNRWQPEISLVCLVHTLAEFPRQDSFNWSEMRASAVDRVLEISFRWLLLGPRQVQMLKPAGLIQNVCALPLPTSCFVVFPGNLYNWHLSSWRS